VPSSCSHGRNFQKDLWFFCSEGSSGNQRAISAQGNRKIQRIGGQEDPVEVGVLRHITYGLDVVTYSRIPVIDLYFL
jgi:hypothetical protein